MATAAQVIEKAFLLILVRQSESPLRPDEFESGIETLNDMMTSWEAGGLPLGYTLVDSLSDEVTVPSFSLLTIKQNLAINLAPEFGAQVDPSLFDNARIAKRALRRAIVRVKGSCFPSTLPIGSGTKGDNTFNDRNFYPGCDEDVLMTEQDGAILLEQATIAAQDT